MLDVLRDQLGWRTRATNHGPFSTESISSVDHCIRYAYMCKLRLGRELIADQLTKGEIMSGMRRFRRGFAATPISALAATAMIAATPAPVVAAQPAGIRIPGQLINADGTPVAGRVLVFVSPQNSDQLDETPVGMAVVGKDGNYSITVPDREATVQLVAAQNDGWVNFVVVAIFADGTIQVNNSSGRMNARSTSYLSTRAGIEPDRVDAEPLRFVKSETPNGGASAQATGVDDQTFDISEFHLTRTLVSDVDDKWGSVSPTGAAATSGSFVLGTSDLWTVIGEFHKWKDTSGTFTYGKRADSDIGGSISYDGTNWSATAAVKISNSASVAVTFSFPNNDTDTFGRQLRSQFRYVKEFNEIVGPGGYYNSWTSIRATQWNTGGDYNGKDKTNEDGHCDTRPNRVSFGKNMSLTRDSLSAYTYSAAVTAFGVGLTAKSGYSTYVQSQWKFGNQYNTYWACGSNAMPGSAHIVYMGPNQ